MTITVKYHGINDQPRLSADSWRYPSLKTEVPQDGPDVISLY
ncbi:hypothetical protein DFAR_2220007 [Desulfarculales bacterium]